MCCRASSGGQFWGDYLESPSNRFKVPLQQLSKRNQWEENVMGDSVFDRHTKISKLMSYNV